MFFWTFFIRNYSNHKKSLNIIDMNSNILQYTTEDGLTKIGAILL